VGLRFFKRGQRPSAAARGDDVGGPSEAMRTTASVSGHVLDCDEAAVSHKKQIVFYRLKNWQFYWFNFLCFIMILLELLFLTYCYLLLYVLQFRALSYMRRMRHRTNFLMHE